MKNMVLHCQFKRRPIAVAFEDMTNGFFYTSVMARGDDCLFMRLGTSLYSFVPGTPVRACPNYSSTECRFQIFEGDINFKQQ